MAQIRFGTDGWRARIAEDFTFANVRLCAAATARYLHEHGFAERGVVVGYDTRFASERFAAAAAETLSAAGVRVYLTPQPLPTPVVSFGVRALATGGAVIITASHNPAEWNGFKVRTETGGSAPPEVTREIERHIAHLQERGELPPTLPLDEGLRRGLVQHYDPVPSYEHHLSQLVDLERLRAADLEVAVDSMYGAGAGYFRRLLSGGRIRVTEIHGERNPLFPGFQQPEPIAHNLRALADLVRERHAFLGLATDGDADRLGVMDEEGRFVTQLQTFALLCYYLLQLRGQRGPLIKTVTTTRMVDQLGEVFSVPVHETDVGFRYVAPLMVQTDALIGGEESGGYGFRGHIPERDGILAGLYFLDLVATTGATPSALIARLYEMLGPHYYDRLDLTFPEAERPRIERRLAEAQPDSIAGTPIAAIERKPDWTRFSLHGGSWLLVRFSGTEPLLRIYTETTDLARCRELLEAGRALIGL